MKTLFVIPIFISFHALLQIEAYSRGAPRLACSSLTPLHLFSRPQQSSPPYRITKEMIGTDTFNVTLSGIRECKGFILQGRDQSGNTVGKFDLGSIGSQDIRLFNCANDDDTASHLNNDFKMSITLLWRGPAEAQMTSTVVKTFRTFWSDIVSN